MIFRNLDTNGDWNFGKGKNDYASSQAAIMLNIKTRLLSWVGDCFFDQTAGVDWYNRLGSKNQQTLLEADLRRVISQSDGVTALKNFDIIMEGRTFKATYTVETVYSASFTDSIQREL